MGRQEIVVEAVGDSRWRSVRLRRGMPAEAAVRAICGALRDVVDARLPGVLERRHPEFLHDLRVAVRRTRSLLRDAGEPLPKAERTSLERELGWLGSITNRARDLDVLLLELPRLEGDLPEEERTALTPIGAALRRRRSAEQRALSRRLRSRRFVRLMAGWAATAEPREIDGGATSAAELAARRIRKAWKRVVRRGRGLHRRSAAADLHRVRIAAKRLRYVLELFGSTLPGKERRQLVGVLKRLQDELGEFNDCEFQVRALREACSGLGTDTAIAVGRLVERLDARQRVARERFEKRFARLSSRRSRRLLERALRRAGNDPR